MTRPFLSLTIMTAVACAACGQDAPADSGVMVSDSAGVTIVVNPDVPLPEWHADSVPLVDIGSADGADGQDLALPWSSLKLADGRIAISNGRSNELRLYTPEGRFIRAVGGEGEGPGEFRLIAALRRARGDSIVATDAAQSRLTVFSSAGEYGRTITLDAIENRAPRLRGVLFDTLGVWGVSVVHRGGGESRAVRDEVIVALRPLHGGETKVLGRFPAAEKFNQVMPHGGIAAWNQPFSRDTYTAVTNDMAWVAQSSAYELHGYNAAGELTRIVRLDRPAAPVRSTDRDRFFEHQLASAETDDQRRMYVDVHRIIAVPPTMPAFSAVISDTAGNLWVKEYSVPWETGPSVWRVFDDSGRATATVRLPADLVVHEIGSDYVLGMWRDELDVEHVRLYRLHRNGR